MLRNCQQILIIVYYNTLYIMIIFIGKGLTQGCSHRNDVMLGPMTSKIHKGISLNTLFLTLVD